MPDDADPEGLGLREVGIPLSELRSTAVMTQGSRGNRPVGAEGESSLDTPRHAQRQFELEFFAALLARRPHWVAVLRAHASNLARTGQYARALIADRRLARLRTGDPITWYNLACTHARLGQRNAALDALEQALVQGYSRIGHLLRDPDLAMLRSDPRFTDLLRRRLSRS
jgi:tetratricopeptide (TPR) repeat protein